jgi:gamma-glutamyltranspeptidase / glutathione hydrolase
MPKAFAPPIFRANHNDMKRFSLPLLSFSLLILPQPVLAQKTGVTASADPRATQAGMEMLRKGGSSADAAMAMMLALTVVEPQSSGIGGGGFLLYQDAGGTLSTINGRETAPMAATPDRFMGADGKPLPFLRAMPGGKSVGVPGNLRLMAMAHQKWGKLPWKTLFGPAIKLADKGFVVNAVMAERLGQVAPLWKQFPESQKLFWRGGKPATAGTLLKNPALAKTLRLLAKKGPDAFYTGTIAKNLVTTVTGAPVNASDMTLADMAAYKAVEQNAVCAPYRIYVVCGMAPPSSGATTVLQILGSLERFDMKALGKDNPQSWHLIAEAMQLAYADREKYLGDPAFVTVPVQGLIDHDYLASRSALINPDKSAVRYEAGTPPGAMPRTAAISGEVAGTTHFVAVDKAGNVATMTSTIEGIFGSQLVTGGFMLNNELTDFTFAPEKDGAPVANRVEGGKRPLSSMSPTMVFDQQGRPVLALGSAGGKRIIMHVTKTLIGVLDFGLPLDQAIALPNIFFAPDALQLEQGTSLAAMADRISAFGQKAVAGDVPSKVTGVQRTDSGWTGAADPRSPGTAVVE